MRIRTRYNRIQEKQAKINLELTVLQSECPHINVTKKAWANSGNYDPSADGYYYDFDCPDCGKHWQEEQGEYHERIRQIKKEHNN